ncbi:MAG: zinc ABC transporter substrate-binding protein [Firmicutes bacterium]|nr:zinc ABC transporter substrate-binding protein [Bacillota bacterium]
MKNKKILRFLIYIICIIMLLICFIGCGKKAEENGLQNGCAEDGGIKVVTTLFAPYDFVNHVAADTDIELSMLIKPGSESHSFDPTAQDIISIKNCDLFIYTGGENDSWVEDILDSLDEPIRTLRMMDHAALVEEETKEGMHTPKFAGHSHDESGEEHEEHNSDADYNEEAEWDEHVWTSPLNAINIIDGISAEMSELRPENAERYAANAESYISSIMNLDKEFKELVSAAEYKTLIFADRFPVRYFTEEFGLDYYAAFPGCSAEAEPSAATVAFLIDKVRSEDIPAVFYIELSDERMADVICEASGAEKLRFHSCHNVTASDFQSGETYLSLMTQNLNNLKRTLKI